MSLRLDAILVIDVESTCWETDPPDGQISEIIEIGLCVVDVRQLEPVEKRSILVKPVRSTISPFCTQLTTLRPEDVDDAGSFADAAQILTKKYRSKDRLWASWGDYDRNQFDRMCQTFGVTYPFGRRHLNVKTLFAVALGLPRELGLDGALKQLGWPLEGTHHRGHDDAWNIGKILCELLRRQRRG